MSVSEAIQAHHQELLDSLKGYSQALSESPSQVDLGELVVFLRQELLSHAQGEERQLYPAVDPLVQAHGKATATMSVDHQFIGGLVAQIEEAAQAAQHATEAARPKIERRLGRLSLQLEAIFQLHLSKEERIYLPLLEKYLSPADQQRILDDMHASPEQSATPVKTTLDLRPMPPRERHPLIFETFESLQPGEAFVLINDHDPKPLFYQFQAERAGQFDWEYLAKGPEAWRVRIGRKAE
ncbi:MAG TPA: DUF2249 domain-containing protein [Candidatus Fraserbacteria bacterium]|nr:DUF2249 domain-containing protein [Candidatus Fraserbacteria bacterium]